MPFILLRPFRGCKTALEIGVLVILSAGVGVLD